MGPHTKGLLLSYSLQSPYSLHGQLCLAGIWDFQSCYTHTHTHTHTHTQPTGPSPSKWKGLNICYEADSILFRVNRSGLNPPQISLALFYDEIIWGRFRLLLAFIHTFLYSYPKGKCKLLIGLTWSFGSVAD